MDKVLESLYNKRAKRSKTTLEADIRRIGS